MQTIITSGPGPLNKKEEILGESIEENSITNNQLNADTTAGEGTDSTGNDKMIPKEEEKTDANFPKSEEKKEDILGFEEVSDAVY